MFTRSLCSTLLLSGALASAIALAQSADNSQGDSASKAADVAADAPQGGTDPLTLPSATPAATTNPAVASPGNLPRAAAATNPPPAPATLAATQPPAGYPSTQYAPARFAPVYPVPVQVPAGTVQGPGGYGATTYYTNQYPVPYPIVVLSSEEQQQAKEFRDTLAQLRSAGTAEEKDAARERLSTIVSAQLERDFQDRERKLVEIETRAKMLRDQLEQRRTSKAEIQKMLMLMIENPETGLGLPPAWMSMLSQPLPAPMPVYSNPSYPSNPSSAAPAYPSQPPSNSKPQTLNEAREQSTPAAVGK